MTHAPEQCQLILLELLTRATPKAEPSTRHLRLDLFDRYLQAGGQPFDDHDQRLTMRFAGGEVSKHHVKATGLAMPTPALPQPTSPPGRG